MVVAEEEIRHDVKVINAHKSYGKNNVLNGLNMSVLSGSIYGLLGASGCGKSTLLQCILGKTRIDSGSIDLKANFVTDIGYMPQDLCLEDLLTIKETIEYYGTLYNMSKKQIDRRIEKINTFLHLPDMNTYIKDLSGGQGRRVSLAVSILHDPKIIILDEPTVGIDPLLRQEIWREFLSMVGNKKTIIITTHYIEEASQVNRIGLMRNGVLVEEGSPQFILNKYEADTLESAFLALCSNQDVNTVIHDEGSDIQARKTVQAQSECLKKTGTNFDPNRIKALMKKNFNVFARDYLLFFTAIIFPIIQTIIFCSGVGVNIKGLQIAVKSDEINISDCNHSEVSGCILNEKANQTMSCAVTNYLASHDYELVGVDDRDVGDLTIKRHQNLLFLHFPRKFTTDLINNYASENSSSYNYESPVYANFAKDNYVLKSQIARDVTDLLEYLVKKTLNGCSINPKAIGLPIEFNTIVGKEVKSYLSSSISFFIAMGTFHLPSTFSLSLMLSERMDGILSRSMLAGVTILEVLISLFCITTLLLFSQLAIPLFILYVLFPNPILITNGLFIYFAIITCTGWIGFFYGIIVAGVSPTKLSGVYSIHGFSMSQFILSGLAWPVEGQAPWLRSISNILPMRIAGKTMNDIALKGWTWDHPSVLHGTAIICGQLTLLVLLLIGLGKIKKDMWVLNK